MAMITPDAWTDEEDNRVIREAYRLVRLLIDRGLASWPGGFGEEVHIGGGVFLLSVPSDDMPLYLEVLVGKNTDLTLDDCDDSDALLIEDYNMVEGNEPKLQGEPYLLRDAVLPLLYKLLPLDALGGVL
jgi:hypothetical protein